MMLASVAINLDWSQDLPFAVVNIAEYPPVPETAPRLPPTLEQNRSTRADEVRNSWAEILCNRDPPSPSVAQITLILKSFLGAQADGSDDKNSIIRMRNDHQNITFFGLHIPVITH